MSQRKAISIAKTKILALKGKYLISAKIMIHHDNRTG
jgi:hypothetical protein